jgi:hypothetical protein
MFPNRDQIERAAYDRWLRRDQAHGRDRDDWLAAENELTFVLNYTSIALYPLDSPTELVLGDGATRRCRLCERTARNTRFSVPRPVVQVAGETSLLSAEICHECQSDCREEIADQCRDFWQTLNPGLDGLQIMPRPLDSIAVLKSLVTSALLIMPESELAYFSDTLEWVSNPDHGYDGRLFAGTLCHLYHAPFLRDRSWTSLARRVDDGAAFPYMLYFVAWGGIILQVPVPLGSPDQDLDGKVVRIPEQSVVSGHGSHFREARSMVMRLGSW